MLHDSSQYLAYLIVYDFDITIIEEMIDIKIK